MANPDTSHAPSASPLSSEELRLIDAWWRACNYLSVGMIYLRDNPLLQKPLKPEHVKNRRCRSCGLISTGSSNATTST
jgi:xylulose-5-phosphate/fructose-6-phosphate phosphoketolase